MMPASCSSVWKALRDDDNSWDFNHDRTYRLYIDRILDD